MSNVPPIDSQALEGQEGDQIPATPLPQDWNAAGDMFSFRYKHPQSAFIFLLKGVKVGDKLIVHGMAIEVMMRSTTFRHGKILIQHYH